MCVFNWAIMVSILALAKKAPTIIFIDELDAKVGANCLCNYFLQCQLNF